MTDVDTSGLFKVGLRVQKATVGLQSNNGELIRSPEYFGGEPHPAMAGGRGWHIRSQEANCVIVPVRYEPPPGLDAYFTVLDEPGASPHIHFSDTEVTAVGDWSALEEETLDRRYSLLGNQGVLFRYILTVLERKGVFSFHACGIQDREDGTVFLVLGERGSGKSALLLAALDSGRYLSFGTEIVHAGVENNELTFYRGCLRNNVRLGHLLYDFPALAEAIGVSFNEVADPWGTKVQLDFGTYAIHADRITAPRLVLVIPRIEEDLRDALVTEVPAEKMARLKRNLLENLSDKIISMALAYETVPIGSLDTPEGLRRRQRFVDFMVDTGTIGRAVNLFASPKNCLEGLHA